MWTGLNGRSDLRCLITFIENNKLFTGLQFFVHMKSGTGAAIRKSVKDEFDKKALKTQPFSIST